MLVEFRVLGELEIRAAGLQVDIGHARQRAVLAVLLFDLGRVVPATLLIERAWGDDPPVSVRNVLYGYIARLRAAIARAGDPAVMLSRQPGGYRLDADLDQVDLYRFRGLVAEAADAAEDGERAGALLAQALMLWRGPALAGMDSPWLNRMRESLELQRRSAVLDLGDITLRQGQHRTLVSSLAEEAATHPADERLIGQLMLALYRSGQQAEALLRFEQTRRRLAEELGADPGPQLQALHQQILRADPSLALADLVDEISLKAHRGQSDYQAGRQSPPADVGSAHEPNRQVTDSPLSSLRAPALSRPSTPRPGRGSRLVTLAVAAFAVVSSILYVGFPAGGASHRAGHLRRAGHLSAARISPDGIVLRDGLSPMRAACASDAVTLASAPIHLPGLVSGTIERWLGNGTLVGNLQLRYSAACHSTWAQFEPVPTAGNSSLRMLVWEIRTDDNRRLAVQARTLRADYTNMLMTGHDCALAGVFITQRTGSDAMITTRCVTARPTGPRPGM
ncbi:MAG TPA: BTAD domain-containing putative transcriptional regulator [Streptosporangiaceae bacterium]|nr:BTAD domain-containing putative transcriptional regulator [Streptosporangiaceae bacterium]